LAAYLPCLLRQDEPRVDLSGQAGRDVAGRENDPRPGGDGPACRSISTGLPTHTVTRVVAAPGGIGPWLVFVRLMLVRCLAAAGDLLGRCGLGDCSGGRGRTLF
jgi:hypothetical protein